MKGRRGALVLVALAALAVAACGSGSGTTSAGSGSSGGTTTVVAPPGPVDPADAYRAAVAAYGAAADPPDPDAAALLDAYTGDALLKARAALGRNRADGIAIRGGRAVLAATVTDEGPDRATVTACERDDQERYRTRDGTVVAPATGATSGVLATLELVDGRWKVASLAPGPAC